MKSLFTPSLFNLSISYPIYTVYNLSICIPPSRNPPSRLLRQFEFLNMKNSSALKNLKISKKAIPPPCYWDSFLFYDFLLKMIPYVRFNIITEHTVGENVSIWWPHWSVEHLETENTGCERYWRPFCDTNKNLHKIFKNNNRLMKFSGIVYLYLDFTFSGWNCL